MASDLERVGRGLDVQNRSVEQLFALMRLTHRSVLDAKRSRSTAPIIEFLHANLAQTLARVGDTTFACRKGCHFCCTSWVAASAPEILYLIARIRAEELGRVRRNVAEASTLTSSLSHEERVKIRTPCPMLDDGLCGIYERRPLVCRTLVSYDAATCEQVYTQFTGHNDAISDIHVLIRNVYALALAGALKHAGLPHYFYEFNAGLRLALDRDDAEAVWLSGEDAFAGVMQDPGGDMFNDPWNRKIYDDAFRRA